MLWMEIPSQNLREGRSAYWNVEQWRTRSTTFSDMAVFDGGTVTLTTPDKAQRLSVTRTTPNLLSILGVQPARGRVFSAEEAEARQRLAVISHRFWQSQFGGSEDAIGATVEIDGVPTKIIGILPETTQFPGADVLQPHTMLPDFEAVREARGGGVWMVLGRLRPDATVEQAQTEMNAIARSLDEQMPAAQRNRGVSVVPFSLQLTGESARLALWMLTGAVFFVLLIAASNVAGLSLARSEAREKDFAIRAALGAGRGRIIRQLLAESLTLSVISGALGLLFAAVGIRALLLLAPANLPRLDEVRLDPIVLGWTSAICLLTGIGVGFAPAIALARRDWTLSKYVGGGRIAGGIRTMRRGLVIMQFALAIILLAGAGLLVRSLWSVQNVDIGFRPERVLSVQLSLPPRSEEQRTLFYHRVLEEIQSLPGVESAGIVGDLFVGGSAEQLLTIEGNDATISERIRLRRDEVSEGFFRTIGTRLLRGRFFSLEDRADSPRVAIINEAMARRLWPGREAVGQRFKLGPADSRNPWFTVAGVVADMRRQTLETEPIPQMFEPLPQNPSRLATLLVRTTAVDPLSIAGPVESAVHRVDKSVPVYGVNTLENRLGGFLAQRRFQSSLLMPFSIAALLMAAIGIYGLMLYSIATRTREIGIRMAVGAGAGAIFRMIGSEGLKLCMSGLALGLLGALWLARAGSSLLFGVSATDPLTFITVSLLLTTAAAAACYFPARRAMKVEPIVALRQE
jgi:predicted permease